MSQVAYFSEAKLHVAQNYDNIWTNFVQWRGGQKKLLKKSVLTERTWISQTTAYPFHLAVSLFILRPRFRFQTSFLNRCSWFCNLRHVNPLTPCAMIINTGTKRLRNKLRWKTLILCKEVRWCRCWQRVCGGNRHPEA